MIKKILGKNGRKNTGYRLKIKLVNNKFLSFVTDFLDHPIDWSDITMLVSSEMVRVEKVKIKRNFAGAEIGRTLHCKILEY